MKKLLRSSTRRPSQPPTPPTPTPSEASTPSTTTKPSTWTHDGGAITFSKVIDADHAAINQSAADLKHASTPEDRRRLLLDVTWRLIRHDFSEDVVMRPAFITHLGQEGIEMAEHDRRDHTAARAELLSIFDSASDLDLSQFPARVGALFAELAEHMRIESREHIPRLEALLGQAESQRLGVEYLHTQIVTPDLEYISKDGVRTRFWKDVEDYARTEPSRFREIWDGFVKGEISVVAQTSGVRLPPKL